MKFTRGPAKMEAKEGGSFEMYGGKIQGKVLELVRNKRDGYEFFFS